MYTQVGLLVSVNLHPKFEMSIFCPFQRYDWSSKI